MEFKDAWVNAFHDHADNLAIAFVKLLGGFSGDAINCTGCAVGVDDGAAQRIVGGAGGRVGLPGLIDWNIASAAST